MQAQPNLAQKFAAAKSDILHNQRLFQQLKTQRLNTLIGKIHEQHR